MGCTPSRRYLQPVPIATRLLGVLLVISCRNLVAELGEFVGATEERIDPFGRDPSPAPLGPVRDQARPDGLEDDVKRWVSSRCSSSATSLGLYGPSYTCPGRSMARIEIPVVGPVEQHHSCTQV